MVLLLMSPNKGFSQVEGRQITGLKTAPAAFLSQSVITLDDHWVVPWWPLSEGTYGYVSLPAQWNEQDPPFLLQSLGPSLTFTLNCLDKDERFLLTWSYMFVRFHWHLLTVIQLGFQAAYSTNILDRHLRSVKCSKHCWEQVRKNHLTDN